MKTDPGARSPRASTYVVAFMLVAALVAGLATFTLLQERIRFREKALVATQNIAKLLEQHTHDVFQAVELLLRSTERYAEDMLAVSHFEPVGLEHFLSDQEGLIPELQGLRITDASGRVRYGVREKLDAPVSVANEPFFTAARDTRSERAVVMGPVFAPIAKKWVIVFARPIRKPDGQFVGVVYANYPTDAFEKVFASVQLGSQGAATIRGTDMALVHRVPTTRNAVGSRNVSRELADIITRTPEGGVYVAATALDGIERSNAYRRLADYPFYVIVGQATSDYLKGWVTSLILVVGLSGFALMAAGVAALSAFRAQRRLVADLAEKTRMADELAQSAEERSELNVELAMRLKQAQAAAVARDAFLAHVSHEMRTPLHQITGLASLVRRQPLSERQAGWISRLENASGRMTLMVDQVLEFVKLESESLAFSLLPVNPARLMSHADARWRERMDAAGLRFRCEAEREADIELRADRNRLDRALDCLLDNALLHTRTGEIVATARFHGQSGNAVWIRFSVRDTGTGFDEAIRERLFNPFEQADSSSTTQQAGMGLSLAILRKTARLMDGDAGCESQPGVGSTFWFTVRMERAGTLDTAMQVSTVERRPA